MKVRTDQTGKTEGSKSRKSQPHDHKTNRKAGASNHDGMIASEPLCKACSNFDFCGKKVLVVGGIDRMESSYRDLVKTCGGSFEHHTGVMKNGTQRLKNSLQRADVVLCPVRCNSHTACRQVKKLGKKFNKPIFFLANFSLNTVGRIMDPGNDGTKH
jgi:Uncharacterized protein conserved in bacteria (DUF2325)